MKQYIYFLLIVLINIQCSFDNEFDNESKITNQIFKDLADSIVFLRIFPPIPPPSKINENGHILFDSALLKDYNEYISKIDTSIHLLSVFDTLQIEDNTFDESIIGRLKDSTFVNYWDIFNSYLKKKKSNQLIDISKICNLGQYRLEKCSDRNVIQNFKKRIFTNKRKIEQYYKDTNLKTSYYGLLTLSRVYFNDKYGFLVCSIFGGTDIYSSHLVLIKKINNKWFIDRVDRLIIA